MSLIIKPEQELKNKQALVDMANLLLNLKKEFRDSHPEDSEELCEWAVEQAIMRLSVNTGHSFE
jgi:hypothetical protein